MDITTSQHCDKRRYEGFLLARSWRFRLQINNQATNTHSEPTNGYFNATTTAAPKTHKVAIDRKRMILRSFGETYR